LVVLCACGRLGFDATPGGDATGDGDGGVELPCNLAGRVADTFDDGIVDEYLWGNTYTNPGTMIAEASGRVTFTLAPNSASTYAGLKSTRFYDMRGQRFIVEVVQIGAAGSHAGIQIEYRNDRYVSLTVKNGNLRAGYSDGTFMVVDMIPYVAAAHRYWAISEDAGNLYFETSQDGISFTSFATLPAPFDVSLVRQTAFAGTDNAVAAPGTFVIESIGATVPVGSSACAASTLVDRFDDGVIGHLWENSYNDPCCTIAEVGGEMVIGYDGTQGTTALRSAPAVDLRGDAVTIRVTQEPPLSSTVLNLTVRRDQSNVLEIQISNTQTLARVTIAGVGNQVMSARNPAERYLRIREAGGAYVMEVSTDRTTWRTLRTDVAPFPLDDVLVTVRAGVSANSTAQKLTSFDDFNAP
jgi:hypothetical protein